MTKSSRTIVSARLDEAIVRKLDRTAREQSRTRTGQLDHILRGYLSGADSASTTTRSSSRMADNTPASSKDGHVPDSRLEKHGSVPEPKYRRPTGEAETLDSTLSHIPPVKREF